uniref:Major facilitator superfamily domain containing 11 n=1 Tax=Nothobranchius furzeri TaxID=105023 RepID=A0A8C6K5Y4_NOTFU
RSMADKSTYNVVILGVGFLLIFTAFTTCGNVEQTVLKGLNNSTFSGSGYHSLGIIYGVFSFSNLLAPTVVTVIGAKLTMFLSGLLYSGYIAVFIIPSTWSFYLTSALIGIGAALLWTAQGHFLVENSEASTINRNTGMFWALLQCSMLFGNLYVYLDWNGKAEISGRIRRGSADSSRIPSGGGLFGLLCRNSRFRRTSVVFLGMVVHFIASYLIFLNIPDDAPIVFESASQKSPYLTPSASIALLCSFLLGLGDSCFNTQLYSILGHVYAEQSTPAFAIFKFIQSVSAAVAFFYSGYLLLMWQLLLLVILGFTGTLCFFVVERMQDFTTDLQED